MKNLVGESANRFGHKMLHAFKWVRVVTNYLSISGEFWKIQQSLYANVQKAEGKGEPKNWAKFTHHILWSPYPMGMKQTDSRYCFKWWHQKLTFFSTLNPTAPPLSLHMKVGTHARCWVLISPPFHGDFAYCYHPFPVKPGRFWAWHKTPFCRNPWTMLQLKKYLISRWYWHQAWVTTFISSDGAGGIAQNPDPSLPFSVRKQGWEAKRLERL